MSRTPLTISLLLLLSISSLLMGCDRYGVNQLDRPAIAAASSPTPQTTPRNEATPVPSPSEYPDNEITVVERSDAYNPNEIVVPFIKPISTPIPARITTTRTSKSPVARTVVTNSAPASRARRVTIPARQWIGIQDRVYSWYKKDQAYHLFCQEQTWSKPQFIALFITNATGEVTGLLTLMEYENLPGGWWFFYPNQKVFGDNKDRMLQNAMNFLSENLQIQWHDNSRFNFTIVERPQTPEKFAYWKGRFNDKMLLIQEEVR